MCYKDNKVELIIKNINAYFTDLYPYFTIEISYIYMKRN